MVQTEALKRLQNQHPTRSSGRELEESRVFVSHITEVSPLQRIVSINEHEMSIVLGRLSHFYKSAVPSGDLGSDYVQMWLISHFYFEKWRKYR